MPSSVPFEDPSLGTLAGFWRTFGWAIGKPSALWRCLPASPIGTAMVFAWMAALPAAAVNVGFGLCGFAVQRSMPQQATGIPAFDQLLAQQTPETMLTQSVIQYVALFVCTPLIALCWAALHHIPVALGGGRGGFGATYRATCYLQPLALFSMACAPFLTVPAWIWHGIVMGFALRRIHGIGGGAAMVGGLLPVIVFVLGCCGLVLVAAMGMAAMMQGVGG